VELSTVAVKLEFTALAVLGMADRQSASRQKHERRRMRTRFFMVGFFMVLKGWADGWS